MGAYFRVKGAEFGYHIKIKKNDGSHSALYDIQILRVLNNT